MASAPRRFEIVEVVGWRGELGACPLSGDNCVRAECTCMGGVCQQRGYLRFNNKEIRKLKIVRKCSGEDVFTMDRPLILHGLKRSRSSPDVAQFNKRRDEPVVTTSGLSKSFEASEDVIVVSSGEEDDAAVLQTGPAESSI